ncbi:MAG: NUDIX domain-containing protein [Bacteroidales bacterium]|nr:NUDIX domain-containing protein [Bacteroidales bacterium]
MWKSLYQFPLIETIEETPVNKLLLLEESKTLLQGTKVDHIKTSEEITHTLTHQVIKARFYHFAAGSLIEKRFFVFTQQLDRYAFPRLIDQYLKKTSYLSV